MYKVFKNIFNTILPINIRYKLEPSLRSIYAIFKIGNSHLCVICNFKSSSFERLANHDLLCPKCGSLSRDRRLWNMIADNSLLKNKTILDFSPSRCLYRKWKKIPTINYFASDLSNNFLSTVEYDITKIPIKHSTFDLIFCYHILEHVIDDVKAMSELFRVLKPNGTLIIQTPFKDGEIYEDYSITSESERLIHFGQEDHVRIYTIQGLKKRLENAGFNVKVNNYEKDDYLGFSDNENILIATK